MGAACLGTGTHTVCSLEHLQPLDLKVKSILVHLQLLLSRTNETSAVSNSLKVCLGPISCWARLRSSHLLIEN